MANKKGKCWCGDKLITGIKDEEGNWFPFGFANCPKHGCWYISKKEYQAQLKKAPK